MMMEDEIGTCLAVLEEAGPKEPRSFAKRIAASKRICYRNIDIPRSARTGIHYILDHPFNEEEEKPYVKAWNLVREWHMIEEIKPVLYALMDSNDERIRNGKVLLIVGAAHVEAIQRHMPQDVSVQYTPFLQEG